jgi:hypothetical protein
MILLRKQRSFQATFADWTRLNARAIEADSAADTTDFACVAHSTQIHI